MIPVYALDPLPTKMVRSIFLAGPTPRDKSVKSWRPHAMQVLESMGYDGHVFVPEPADGIWQRDYVAQVAWEEAALNQADCILFWLPRDMATLPALTTNDEWGVWKESGKVVFGAPEGAEKVRYQRYYADKYGVPVGDTMLSAAKAAISMVGEGSLRTGGEVKVPLHVWRQPSFQNWYQAQTGAGNVLKDARVLWHTKIGKTGGIFCWVIHVDVYIASEDRIKSNEFVLGRPDISSVVLWHRAPSLADTEVVIIKEFRSPARTPDGFIREVPGGSTKSDQAPKEIAVEEVEEEAAFTIDPDRLIGHGFRQVYGTLSASGAHVYSAEITDEELEYLKSQVDKPHGLAEDSERTFVEVCTVGDLLTAPLTDWASLGAIFSALAKAMR